MCVRGRRRQVTTPWGRAGGALLTGLEHAQPKQILVLTCTVLSTSFIGPLTIASDYSPAFASVESQAFEYTILVHVLYGKRVDLGSTEAIAAGERVNVHVHWAQYTC